MSDQERTESRRDRRSPGGGGDEPPGHARAQARQFGQVAREANEDCLRGIDAQKELATRDNGPGQ